MENHYLCLFCGIIAEAHQDFNLSPPRTPTPTPNPPRNPPYPAPPIGFDDLMSSEVTGGDPTVTNAPLFP